MYKVEIRYYRKGRWYTEYRKIEAFNMHNALIQANILVKDFTNTALSLEEGDIVISYVHRKG